MVIFVSLGVRYLSLRKKKTTNIQTKPSIASALMGFKTYLLMNEKAPSINVFANSMGKTGDIVTLYAWHLTWNPQVDKETNLNSSLLAVISVCCLSTPRSFTQTRTKSLVCDQTVFGCKLYNDEKKRACVKWETSKKCWKVTLKINTPT